MGISHVKYLDNGGVEQSLAFIERGTAYPLSLQRERMAQLLALGHHTPLDAYLEAFDKQPKTDIERRSCSEIASRLGADTQLVLRVQELQRPVLRKLRAKIEYNMQSALSQCQAAWDLAYQQSNPAIMLKAVELQAKLSKLLSEEVNVNHRYGLLDDASTEVLLAMRKDLEVRHTKKKKLVMLAAEKEESVSAGGQGPSAELERVPSDGSSFNSGSENFIEVTPST